MLDKKITHSIYLIKSDFVENEQFLQNIDDCHHYSIPISGYPNAEVYLKTISSKSHDWSKLLPTKVSGIDWSHYYTRSLFGLLLMEVENRLFALTSGFGRFLLHPFSFENRFGFKAVLNSIEPQTIQQLSKMTLSQNPKTSIEQVSKGVNLGQFGIDGFLDLIQRVKGKSKIESLGLSLDGEDALKISVAYELDQLPALLSECLTLYGSKEYTTFFPEVDNLAEVKDKEQKSLLNSDIESQLNNELERYSTREELSGDVWASIPEIVFDADYDCFTYKKDGGALRYYDIELSILFRELYLKKDRSKKRNVTVSSLTNDQIFIRKADGSFYEKWRAISCINAIIERNSEKYFFIAGKWFRASSSYLDTLDQKINAFLRLI